MDKNQYALAKHQLGRFTLAWLSAFSLMLCVPVNTVFAAEFSLVIQPIQSPPRTRASFQPLADYIKERTGYSIKLVTAINFVAYWRTMRKGGYDLILDAAHFTDYRIQRMAYVPLVKIKNVVSFTLVAHKDNLILDPGELIGQPVAVLSSPSLAAVRLAELYPHPMRQPVIVEAANAEDAVRKVEQGKAVAAIIPSPLVGAYRFLAPVETTEQVPHMALSAAERVPEVVRTAIRAALLEAPSHPAGRRLLEELQLEGFEATDAKTYQGYAKLLKGVFGY